MKIIIKKGATSVLVRVFFQDTTSTTGAGLTGLTASSAGLVCYRARDDDGNVGGTQVVLSAGTRGTWSSGGFVEKDATNMPGLYEFGVDNAGLAAGTLTVDYSFKGATNLAQNLMEVQLVAYDPQDAVHLGLSALPNTAVTTNGSLITSGSSTDQLLVSSGKIAVATGGIISTSFATGAITTAACAANFLTGALLGSDFATVFAADPITESYAAQGAGLTIAQFAYATNQFLGQKAISGTTVTVKKRDESTTAKTYTLDSATTPTTITETT